MPLRVLIVENAAVVARDLQDLIKVAGHTALGQAATMAQELKLAEGRRPDVVVVDVGLDDGTSGFEVAEMLHNLYGTRCLFVTGTSDFYVRAMSMSAEPLGYITKPYTSDEVLAALKRA